MDLQDSRYQRQLLGGEKWKANGGVGTLQYPTGVGKTFVAVNIIMKKMQEKDPTRNFVVVVPTVELKLQWEQHLEDAGINFYTVYVINTIINDGVEITCDLLVLDEIHRYASDKFKDVFQLVIYKYILGLTATLARMDQKHWFIANFCPVVDTITPEEARKNQWTSEYREYALGITLDTAAQQDYDKVNERFNHYFGKFDRDFNLMMECLSSSEACKKFAYQMGWTNSNAQTHSWSPVKIRFYSFKANEAMQDRKRMLYNTTTKLQVVLDISKHLMRRKTIIFSESTDFADNVALSIGHQCKAYHSNLEPIIETRRVLEKGQVIEKPKKISATLQKRRIVDSFKKGKLRIISTAKALDEGFDVPDIEVAIVASYTSNPTQKIQRRGRAIRKWDFKSGKSKKALIIYLYIKNTQEEVWLKKSLKDSHNITYVEHVDEIFRQTKITLFGPKPDRH